MKISVAVVASALVLSGCSRLGFSSPSDICAAPETLRAIHDQATNDDNNAQLDKELAAFISPYFKPELFKDIVAESDDRSVGKTECTASIPLGMPSGMYLALGAAKDLHFASLKGELALRISYEVVHASDGKSVVRILNDGEVGELFARLWVMDEARKHVGDKNDDPDTYPADAEHMPEANDPNLVSGNDSGGNDMTAAANEENIVSQP